MSTERKLTWKNFWSSVGYGVSACVILAIPLIAIDWLLSNLPGLDRLLDLLDNLDTPVLGVVIGAACALLALAVLGFVLREYLWDMLTRLPVLGTLMTSGQQMARVLSSIDRERRDMVAWVQFHRYRELGIVVSQTADADGTPYVTVYLFAGAGQFQGNTMVSVPADKVVYPGWTVDDAIVFSSSGGAVVPTTAVQPSENGEKAV